MIEVMEQTIAALSTPPGISGIAVIRLSGEESFSIADKCFRGKILLNDANTHTMHFGEFYDENGKIDDVVASVYRSPHSYTGENVLEISCHGGYFVVQIIINTLIRCGARFAQPGEFTKRAFLNGRIDLTQAEAVADMIYSEAVPATRTAARQLSGSFAHKLEKLRDKLIKSASMLELELDFSEEDIALEDRTILLKNLVETSNYFAEIASSFQTAEILRSGYYVSIIGYPNTGKSTLFNTLLQRKRAIVSDIPGTTRDYLEESIILNGITIKLVDTAGMRDSSDLIEIEGIKFAESKLNECNMNLIINDFSKSETLSNSLIQIIKEKYPDCKTVLIQNKIDKLDKGNFNKTNDMLYISAKEELGIDELKKFISDSATENIERINDVLINKRQHTLLLQASDSLNEAMEAIKLNLSNEFAIDHIRRASRNLGELIGLDWNDEVLNSIFSKFCIGK
jgi:tRNA modification GTPase